MPPRLAVLLLLDLLLSIVAFALYAWDKAAARAGRRRVPERVLHLIALLGGWPGALLAQSAFHHKTRKHPFQTAFRAAVLLNVLATVALIAIPTPSMTP